MSTNLPKTKNAPKPQLSKVSENSSFHKVVTTDLTNIIKDLQKQLAKAYVEKPTVEEVPSSLIETKRQEFFKGAVKVGLTVAGTSNTPKPAPKVPITIKKPEIPRQSSSKFSNTSTNTSTTSNIRSTSKRTSLQTSDPLKQLKEQVMRAMREHKTFTVRGNYTAIRRALQSRGWVERYHISYQGQLDEQFKNFQSFSIPELLPFLKNEDVTQTCKNLIKSKLLGNHQVDFYWGMNDESFKDNPENVKLTYINKLKRDIFSYTNKQGLCDANKQAHWFQKDQVSKLNHPRSYSLSKNGDMKGFLEDFNKTAALSLLNWIVKINTTKECKLVSPIGKIPLEVFEFAVNECCKIIKRGRHEDIDIDIQEATEQEWNKFLDYFYKLVHYSNHFKSEDRLGESTIVGKSVFILNNIKEYWPWIDMDGMMNIWMLKPTSSSRGRGIHICRTLDYIMRTIKQNTNIRYIVQKYVERPLLIHNTKFDIRQWFLISRTSPLTIWIYKDSYLRFSSQTYNLRKLHESIHLTNNAVQSKYKNTSVDAALPSYNMWDSKEFQAYLCNIGYPKAFREIIYPEMKQCITAAVLMHQEKMIIRRNCFELYGADFILTEDFQPWLLEINSNPALNASTPITSRMCPRVLEDVIKVIIDYSRNIKADTGGFELMYQETTTVLPPPCHLVVLGESLENNYFYTPESELRLPEIHPVLQEKQSDKWQTIGQDIKDNLVSLLKIIHKEKSKQVMKNIRDIGNQ